MNMRGKLYPDLIPDGAIGPRTITALKGYLSARGKEGEQVLLRALNCSRGHQIPPNWRRAAKPTKISSTAGLRSVSCEDDHFRFARAGGCARSVTSAQIYPAGVRRPCQPAAEKRGLLSWELSARWLAYGRSRSRMLRCTPGRYCRPISNILPPNIVALISPALVVLAVLSQYVRQPALKDKADKLKEPQQ